MLDTQANTVMQSLISLQKWFIYLEKVRESTEKLWWWKQKVTGHKIHTHKNINSFSIYQQLSGTKDTHMHTHP